MSTFSTATDRKAANGAPSAQKVETKKNKAKKITVVITYLIALVCLLAGLLAPLYQFGNEALANEELGLTGYMMIRHVPHMLNKVFMTEIVPAEIPWFTNVVAQNLDFFSSLVGILYTLLCMVALIMFIPVCVGNKDKRTSANCALVMEIIALVVLLSYIAYYAFFLVLLGVVAWTDYNILIAFGGTLVIAIVQSITTKGSIGVSKTAAILFSALAVIALVDITLFAPFLADPMNSLSAAIGSGEKANFVGGLLSGVPGSDIGLFGIASLFSVGAVFEALSGATLLLVLYVLWMAVAILTVVNMVVDVIGLGTGRKFEENGKPCKNSGSNIFALVRYSLAFVLTVAIIIFAIVLEGITAGVYLYLLAIVLFLEIMNAMGRTIAANKRAKKAAAGYVAPKAKAPEKAKKP
ncbi:MAG: hypothetical protein K2O67_00495, partial [Clostridia bacterium]|nr:hypothetical protein [Clostridia bacterium]